METKKLTQDEINFLSDLQVKNQELIVKFGQLEYEIQTLSFQKQNLIKELETLRQTELDLSKQLQFKYGEGALNLATGEITPIS